MKNAPLIAFALALFPLLASGSDACIGRSVVTAADVSVSDGTSFRTESFYQSPDRAAIRHIDDRDRLVAVEGPFGWAREGERTQTGPDFYKLFALGHQYHALLLEFESVVERIRTSDSVEFGGRRLAARSGSYPYGGTVHLVLGEEASRPAGMRFDFPEDTVIEARFLDWRVHEDSELPFHISIDDGERTFDYRYTDIRIATASPAWFAGAFSGPVPDEVGVYRLHRNLLAAHCVGDAARMAALSAPDVISANRGEIASTSNAELEERFASLFAALDYTEYHDLSDPVVEVSGDGTVAWIAVSTRGKGTVRATEQPFDDQWAWIMTARKIDGRWLHSANASSRLE